MEYSLVSVDLNENFGGKKITENLNLNFSKCFNFKAEKFKFGKCKKKINKI